MNTGNSHIGGAETQQFQFSRALRARGHDVSFIVALSPGYDSTGKKLPDWVYVAYDMRVHSGKIGYMNDSINLFKAMKLTDSYIFLQRCSFHDAPRVWLFSRILGAKFIFWVGADYNVDKNWLKNNLSAVRRKSYLHAISHADAVICQTSYQQKRLMDNYSIRSNVIRNIVLIPEFLPDRSIQNSRPTAIWAGRINKNKQPGKLLQIARRTKGWNFIAVAIKERGLQNEYKSFVDEAENVPNLKVLTSLPHQDFLELTGKSDLILNTSGYEGYPNTLLEGFARAVPALTLGVDPDGCIQQEQLGWVCNSVEEASSTLNTILNEKSLLDEAGHRALNYVKNNHSVDQVVPILDSLLKELKINR